MSRHARLPWARAQALLALTAVIAGVMVAGASPAAAAVIEQEGQSPLNRIEVTPDLNCAVNHVLDQSGEFFSDTACATLLSSGGTLFGPADIPAGSGAGPRTTYTVPSNNQTVSGSGTVADPFEIVTDVDLGASGLHITQTDSYVNGQESYRTDVTVSNTGVDSVNAKLYRAGDCFLQDSDEGFGSVDAATGAVACVNGVTDPETQQTVPGDRIEQWLPISPGSNYLESDFGTVWATIGQQLSFPNTCRCNEFIDNGAGLSWNLTVPGGSSVTRSHLTTFSPEGTQPLIATKVAESSTAAAGSTDGYTITISNPNATAVTLDSIFDTLPAGFSYVAGSTTGITTNDPTIDGQTLTWSNPGAVPADGSADLQFEVTVSSTPGTYTNSAGANAGSFAVAPTGPTAPITVTGEGEGADLSLTKSDAAPFGPDPVSSGGLVAYQISVSNAGPSTATGVTVTDTPSGGTIDSASGAGWNCTTSPSSATCTRTSPLGADETDSNLTVLVRAPNRATDGSMSDTAEVSSDVPDSVPGNNSDTEGTSIRGSGSASSRDQASTFYDGIHTATVQTKRDTAGGFYSKIVVPPGLSPGVVSIDERPASEFPTFCGGAKCYKQVQISVLPAGQTPADDPIHVFFFFPPPGEDRNEGKLYVKGDAESVASVVPKCIQKGVADPGKCLNAKKILENGDVRWEMLWRDGGDPVGAKRR